MARHKDVLTTGEVAKICNVAPRTVSKWFDSGKLRGYRIPGSKDRRIPIQHLVKFMKDHGMPLNGLETSAMRVLVVDADESHANALCNALNKHQFETDVARSAFETGAKAVTFKPQALLIDVNLPDIAERETLRQMRNVSEIHHAHIIAVAPENANEGNQAALSQQGFDAVLKRPLTPEAVLQVLDDLLAVSA